MIVEEGTVFTVVISINNEELEILRKKLTVFVDNFWFSKKYQQGLWDGTKSFLLKDYRNKVYYFKTGFLSYLEDELVINRRKRREKIKPLSPTILKTKKMTGKYSYQLEAIREVLENKRGVLNLGTGAGKTAIASGISIYAPKKVLFVVPRIELMRQTASMFSEETDLKITTIGGNSFLEEDFDVCVGVIDSLHNKRKDLKWFSQFRTVFVDECHRGSAKTYIDVLDICVSADYRIGLSGTPFHTTTVRNMELIGSLGVELKKISGSELTKMGVNAKPYIFMISVEKPQILDDWPVCYEEGVVRNTFRNGKIIELVDNKIKEEKYGIVLVSRHEHGKLLERAFLDKGIEIPYICGETPNQKRKFFIDGLKSKEIPILILSKIGEEGNDIPHLNFVIRASGGLSSISTLQALGRGLRRKEKGENIVEYYDFNDKTCPILEGHSRVRIKDYISNGYEVYYD